MLTHRDYPAIICWEGEKELAPGMPYPTHFRQGYNGSLKPILSTPRYKHGDQVQRKPLSDGVRTITRVLIYQFRSHPPEPVYVLDDGSHVSDYGVY